MKGLTTLRNNVTKQDVDYDESIRRLADVDTKNQQILVFVTRRTLHTPRYLMSESVECFLRMQPLVLRIKRNFSLHNYKMLV